MPTNSGSTAALALVFLAGAGAVLGYAPFGLWPLQILSLSLLFLLALRAPTVRAAFRLGWAWSFGLLAAGTWWLYVSLHDYGGLPAPLAILAVLLLAALLALLYGLALGGAKALQGRLGPAWSLWLFPSCWMLADWLRGWIFTGFPWLATGYAHTNSPLAGFAPLVGAYGMSWLATLLAVSITLLLLRSTARMVAVALLVVLPAAGVALQSVAWTAPAGQPLAVRLLQGNVPQDLKFDPAQLEQTLALYRRMVMQEEGGPAAGLIVTPETALPLLDTQLPPGYLDDLAQHGKRSGSALLVGIPTSTAPGVYYNSVIGIAAGDVAAYRYDKHHLVPFGEFIPPGARWFVEMMRIPLGDFGRGDPLQAPFGVRDQQVLPNICYEDLFGEEIAAQIGAAFTRGSPEPTMLLNLSNIAWFGDTIALPQHLQISQMRTLETGRPMLRATNTGATALVAAGGRLVAQLPPFTRGSLQVQVQGMQGRTPYVMFGNSLPAGLAIGLLLAGWLLARRRAGAQ